MSRDTPLPYVCVGRTETWSSNRFVWSLFVKQVLYITQYQFYMYLDWVLFLAPVRWAKTVFGPKSREIKF